MDPAANEFVPGRPRRPPNINTNLPPAAFMRDAPQVAAYSPYVANNSNNTSQWPSQVGLGISPATNSYAQTASQAQGHVAPWTAHPSGVSANTQHAHLGQPTNHPGPQTFPLPQTAFLPSGTPNQSCFGSASGQHFNLSSHASHGNLKTSSGAPSSSFSSNHRQSTVYTLPSSDHLSDMSPHYLEANPGLKDQSPEVFIQETHPRSFKRFAMTDRVEMAEMYPGAMDEVNKLNPEYYQMPYGTRVVNIKTESVKNIEVSIRAELWSTLDVVSNRIMQVYDSRKDKKKEKVLFLFAVSGSKQFCGLAEMTGKWNPDKIFEGFAPNSSGARNVGTIPLTWLYVKNVPYAKFQSLAQITQGRGQQNVTNMWNGMHYESDIGRKVIELYVSATHFSNVLAWPKPTNDDIGPRSSSFDWQTRGHNPNRGVGHHSVPHARAMRGGRGNHPARGEFSGRSDSFAAKVNANWREAGNQAQAAGSIENKAHDTDPTPTASRMPASGAVSQLTLPHTDGSLEAGRELHSSMVVPCILDEQGNYVPITPSVPDISPLSMRSVAEHVTDPFKGKDSRGDVEGMTRQQAQVGQVNYPYPPKDFDGGHVTGKQSRSGLQPVASMMFQPQHVNSAQDMRKIASTANFHATGSSNAQHLGVLGHSQFDHASKVTRQGIIAQAPNAGGSSKTFTHGSANSNAGPKSEGADSYPSHFKGPDSMAGWDSRRVPHLEVAMPPRNVAPTCSTESKENTSGGHGLVGITQPAAAHHSGQKSVTMDQWIEKTPTQSITPQLLLAEGLNADSVPEELRATFYRTMAEKKHIEIKIGKVEAKTAELKTAGEDSKEEEMKYFDLMAKLSDLATQLKRLMSGECLEHSDTPCHNRDRGESEADSTTYETSSIEKHNISPERADDGRILYSISQAGDINTDRAGNPIKKETRAGARARNAPYDFSAENLIKASVAHARGPPSSLYGNYHVSPPTQSEAGESIITNPFGDNDTDGGGCRLES
ncbi:hypothetical protein KC340_g3009 [Hortaea werneckii]|nr:hypothetical protein KC342_g3594 [Hortaea werneckii]KAI7103499.1 hypothetical protein KC339_g5217 [Hortaea werneckii]KAI7244222.1 hypothetical protein KC365_g1612 [Hortaea werneckii]KAI7333234.1 hypothetical protein KC340_g3009 [Hortaea werneckii]KAI7400219.1 hypothetical protein KC328_g3644 [Hortaea werneckii]